MAAFAYCADTRLQNPLMVSCANLLRSAGDRTHLDIYAILDGWNSRQVDRLRRVLDQTRTSYSMTLIPWNPQRYSAFRPFQGSWTCYAILDLLEKVPVKRLVYLDADTVPTIEALALAKSNLQGFVLSGVTWGVTAAEAHEAELYRKCGMTAETPVFNSGVMLVDTLAWQRDRYTESAIEVGSQVGSLLTGDQTVLNLLLRGNFLELPWHFNVRLHANADPYAGPGIAHFVGRPKPWTIAGLLMHRNFPLWSRAAKLANRPPMGPLR